MSKLDFKEVVQNAKDAMKKEWGSLGIVGANSNLQSKKRGSSIKYIPRKKIVDIGYITGIKQIEISR